MFNKKSGKEGKIRRFINDIGKSSEENINQIPVSPMNRLPYNIKYGLTQDGKLQVDFQDNRKSSILEDTTRLIVDSRYSVVQGRNLYPCKVSWYDQDDTIMIKDNIEYGRRTAYENILLELDLNLLQNDPYYVETLMNEVLVYGRVSDKLRFGMEDTPKRPCGNYLGGVCWDPTIGRYRKYFEDDVGYAVHYSPEMQGKRMRRKLDEQRRREEKIKQNNSKIKSLQEENKKLEEDMYH